MARGEGTFFLKPETRSEPIARDILISLKPRCKTAARTGSTGHELREAPLCGRCHAGCCRGHRSRRPSSVSLRRLNSVDKAMDGCEVGSKEPASVRRRRHRRNPARRGRGSEGVGEGPRGQRCRNDPKITARSSPTEPHKQRRVTNTGAGAEGGDRPRIRSPAFTRDADTHLPGVRAEPCVQLSARSHIH